MIATFNELIQEQRQLAKPARVVIAMADEEEIQLARQSLEQGLAEFILVGRKKRIEELLRENDMSLDACPIFECDAEQKAAAMAIDMVRQGDADLPMKGLMQTGSFMRAVLDKASGIPAYRRISQITVFTGNNGRLQFLTDCAINISPDLKTKKDIIENAVDTARALGYDCPRVALLGAAEMVVESQPDTLESAALTQMNRRGQIRNCIVDGPLSLDNAISAEAAKLKGIDGPVAGAADIIVGSSLQEANTFSKSLHYYAHIQTASVIAGTTTPIIMTSRTDEVENKINSIAVSCYLRTVRAGG